VVGIIYSFTSYLRRADSGYLDLAEPSMRQLRCGLAEAPCVGDENPLCFLEKHERFALSVDLESTLPALQNTCDPTPLGDCSTVTLPLRVMHGSLGALHSIRGIFNPLRLWANIYAVLTSLLLLSVAVHDHALLMPCCRPRISSLRTMREERPRWWRRLSALQCMHGMHCLRTSRPCAWKILLAPWYLYRLLVFVSLVYPVSLLAFVCQPVKLSRIMVASTALLCALVSLTFISTMLITRDIYALFWSEPRLAPNCICLCEFRLSFEVLLRLEFLGFLVLIASVSIGMRAFKGLRRGNWANLLSVLYAVPVEVFPVYWERPSEVGGGTIRHRVFGEAVQGEPAFDPFALMDEQPESGASTVRLRPVPLAEEQTMRWAKTEGSPDAEIGCCGFPVPGYLRAAHEEDYSARGTSSDPVIGIILASPMPQNLEAQETQPPIILSVNVGPDCHPSAGAAPSKCYTASNANRVTLPNTTSGDSKPQGSSDGPTGGRELDNLAAPAASSNDIGDNHAQSGDGVTKPVEGC